MKENQFQLRKPDIVRNQKLRKPQREGYIAIQDYFSNANAEREVGVMLPVGCGKSGLITIAPFALRSQRTLVIAPGREIAGQLLRDFDPTSAEFFYEKCFVLQGPPYPEAAEIRRAIRADIDEADVVVTNIHQLQGQGNKWLSQLPPDFFDLNYSSCFDCVWRAGHAEPYNYR
jgi:hypothetical protein